jgi:hypothetical protein
MDGGKIEGAPSQVGVKKRRKQKHEVRDRIPKR